jgi:DNA-binding transcriptional regulator LsrR (DeoR family)
MKYSDQDLETMAEVASLYYEYDMNQQHISKQLFISRSKVSRMLKKAKELHIVDININYPVSRVKGLEILLKEKYQLNEVIVVKDDINHNNDLALKKICLIASKYIDSIIEDGSTIGLSWGQTVYNLIKVLKPTTSKDINVVQLTGIVSEWEVSNYDAIELVRSLAKKYGGKFTPLYSPLYFDSKESLEAAKKQTIIANNREKAKNCDIVITGISGFDMDSKTVWGNYLTDNSKKYLLKQGATGVFLAHYIALNGEICYKKLDNRTMSLDLEDIEKVKNVITIARGTRKAKAILSALRGNYINTLIIDEELALALENTE